jgi:hypothetical protein
VQARRLIAESSGPRCGSPYMNIYVYYENYIFEYNAVPTLIEQV